MTTEPAEPGIRPGADGATGLPVLDPLDHAILRTLHRDPRAPFAQIAAATGVHERTIARRLERMTATGEVRFTASLLSEHLGEGSTVELAVRCAPGRLHETALALARRPDTRSVEVATGSLDAYAELTVPSPEHLLAVVDGSIGRLDGVLGVHSSVVLRLLLTASDWAPYDEEPTPVRRRLAQGQPAPEPITVDELDRQLVRLLQDDARMSTTALARALSVGETTARRRLTRLMASHVLHLRLHAEPAILGYPVEARFRLTVTPRGLDAALRRLAAEPAVRQLVTTTGASNLLGYSSHRTPAELDGFTARALADLDGVLGVETALLMRTYKRGWVAGPGPRDRPGAGRAPAPLSSRM
ncbi:Lrp/AsnC family transcriptional regulator [Kitasatospora viridis]|uniref:DNA-binding Lrp family transcriptional regulator n=1 Tax=Kitasatospora viridis TaxID=281105 RepID=A0A561TWR4_9ACTN|nr:Lrp/AsnC family transcriptional regulator [Kitasatospora viridis]TWF91550.1 DNA-binding Lrp family transcriptional regulator [Kitasatospora viridis]